MKTTPEKSLDIYLSQARSHGLEREFWLSYREYKPWWAFWVSEAEAAAEALIDLDL